MRRKNVYWKRFSYGNISVTKIQLNILTISARHKQPQSNKVDFYFVFVANEDDNENDNEEHNNNNNTKFLTK